MKKNKFKKALKIVKKLIINIAGNQPNYFEISKLVTSSNDEYVLFGILIFRDILFTNLRCLFSSNSRSIISIAER